ncbi:MAG: DAK2 domain-containing protein [Alicyclobacillus shizuokensis]|nr:DAK2 domain-containing protein [Alicyclobacillus shizuokensis]
MTGQQVLTGTAFAALMRRGHQRLHEQAEVVNALNIFPVPDGDTGTNMDLSLGAGVAALDQRSEWSLQEATQALATGLLMGARGNSGVILSQLFRGFSKAAQGATGMDVRVFAQALQEGIDIAYKAVSKPVEGTILTVAREAASVAVREARQNPTWAVLMEQVYEAAQAALQRTPSQLPVLKQAGVVDSGGQGLVFIYEGFLEYLRGHESPAASPGDELHSVVARPVLEYAGSHIARTGENGYCTEVLVRAGARASLVEGQLRERLGQYGDSLLVVAAEDLVRVHVHTLHPGRVLEDALTCGPLVQIKVENMTEQHDRISDLETVAKADSSASVAATPDHDGILKEDRDRGAVTALVAAASGDGIRDVFESLGATVIDGGQSMNPSTEEIVAAAQNAGGRQVVFLPNNKNIVLAAEQAREVLEGGLEVVPCTSIPQGLAAAAVFDARESATANRARMEASLHAVQSGCVARAARDSQYQGHAIAAGQYMAIAEADVVEVHADRAAAAVAAVRAMVAAARGNGVDAELLTVFYSDQVDETEREELRRTLAHLYGFEIEMRYGGQPVYDYIFSLE